MNFNGRHFWAEQRSGSLRALGVLASAGLCAWAVPCAASAIAGSTIVNTAQVDFTIDGSSKSVSSNTTALRIDETLDLALLGGTSAPAITGSETSVPFTIRNDGNGNEAFVLHAEVDGADVSILGFAIDVDGNGVFDPAIDTAIPNDGSTPLIAPGGSLRMLLRVRANAAIGGTLRIGARAVTGSGTPGTTFAGKGDGGVNALVGKTTAAALVSMPFVNAAGQADATLIKSQSVLAPDGTDTAMEGAIVTYSIEARFTGPDFARGAQISDPLPAGTEYVPQSLRLDGAALADAGHFDGAAITVSLGDVAASVTRTVSFQVKIL